MVFPSRFQAGKTLAQKLLSEGGARPVVLGIPRGGVLTAAPVARTLSCPFGVVVIKKLAAPKNEELAIGAIGEDEESLFLNKKLLDSLAVNQSYLDQEKKRVKAEVKRRHRLLLGDRRLELENKKVIIVDDGIATGATAVSAVRQVRLSKPDEIIVATPVITQEARFLLKKEADRLVYLQSPELFFSVSQFYERFPQVSDEQAKSLLSQAE